MGAYINPQNQTKEEFLQVKGKRLTIEEAKHWENYTDSFLVVLLDNGYFTAAGIAFDSREKEEFLRDSDLRPKTYWAVKIEDLLLVSNLKQYLKSSPA